METQALKLLKVEESTAPISLDQAFRRFSPYVAKIAYRLLGRDAEVDDLVQDVFLAATRGLERLREPEAIRGWLATVTVRLGTRRLRWRRVRQFVGLDDSAPELTCAAQSHERALLGRIYRILDSLPVNERVAWTLRHVEGEPLDRVAALCECSLATAKRRIARVQAELDEVLRD
jgi:RNA polymerase sigma-70 factor (ECF subfamily)